MNTDSGTQEVTVRITVATGHLCMINWLDLLELERTIHNLRIAGAGDELLRDFLYDEWTELAIYRFCSSTLDRAIRWGLERWHYQSRNLQNELTTAVSDGRQDVDPDDGFVLADSRPEADEAYWLSHGVLIDIPESLEHRVQLVELVAGL